MKTNTYGGGNRKTKLFIDGEFLLTILHFLTKHFLVYFYRSVKIVTLVLEYPHSLFIWFDKLC